MIVVPYRNREEHLKEFLQNTPDYFCKQNLSFDILITELDQQGDWNAGLCVNSLIEYVKAKQVNYKWLYIHHVDVWPTKGTWKFPDSEKEVYFNLGDYGSCVMTTNAFLDVNGYSNSFWGWGGEDNELYQKLKQKGYTVTDISTSFPVKYDIKFQNHSRKFNGKNYANSIKQLMLLPEEQRNSIKDFYERASVGPVTSVQQNVEKQIVYPLQKSPDQFQNNKVVLGYLKGVAKFEDVVAYVKSLGMFAAYEFDSVIILADETPSEEIKNQLEAFGVKWIHRKQEREDLFFDRYLAYKEFLINNPQYVYALHTDVTDVIFQQNPFNYLDLQKITLTSEGIKIKEEKWNYNMCKGLYGAKAELFVDNFVLCGGIVGAPRDKFIELCDLVVNEFDSLVIGASAARGSDQPVLNKLIWQDKIFEKEIDVKTPNDLFAINLHSPIYYPDKFPNVKILSNKVISETSNTKYAIVHQYNRCSELFNNIKKHYKQFYYPIG